MIDMKRRCGLCRHFELDWYDKNGPGECRRFPPQVLFSPARGFSLDQVDWRFPKVSQGKFCGEFAEKAK